MPQSGICFNLSQFLEILVNTLLLSLFPVFPMQNEDDSRPSGNIENETAWELRETVKTSITSLFQVLVPVSLIFGIMLS